MERRGEHYLVACLIVAAVLVAGCAPSRSAYFSGLRRSRLEAYRRWRKQSRTDERPRIEGKLSLQEAVRLALQHNVRLQAALQQKEIARARVIEGYSEALPTVDLDVGYVRKDQIFVVDLGGASFPVGDLDNYSYRVTVTQPIYKGGAFGIAYRAARVYKYLSDETIRGTAEDVIFDVANAYYDCLLAERLIAVHEAALESAKAHLRAVELKLHEQMATQYDLLRARVEVANVQADLIGQKTQVDIARSKLFRNMGVSQHSRVEPTTPLRFQQQPEVTFSDAVRAAFQNRPDIYQAAMNVDLQDLALSDAYTGYLPRVEAYYWNTWAKPDPHLGSRINWGRQWEAGLALNWTLFDGFAREGRIIREKALLRQREILLGDAEEGAIDEIRRAVVQLQSARELLQSQELNRQEAGRALELVQEGYRVGVNTELEVRDARTALTRAGGLYYTALHKHTVDRIGLQKAMGLLGPGPGAQEVHQRVPTLDGVAAAIQEEQKVKGER